MSHPVRSLLGLLSHNFEMYLYCYFLLLFLPATAVQTFQGQKNEPDYRKQTETPREQQTSGSKRHAEEKERLVALSCMGHLWKKAPLSLLDSLHPFSPRGWWKPICCIQSRTCYNQFHRQIQSLCLLLMPAVQILSGDPNPCIKFFSIWEWYKIFCQEEWKTSSEDQH